MSVGGRLFARMYDRSIAGAERAGLRAHREALLASAHGEVLEIGGGTGANLPFYGRSVESLTMTEPEVPMLTRLKRRVQAETDGPPTIVLRAPAEDLPFEDDTFDVAVSTLVLCTVSDQPRALRELRRVLRPDGRLLFIEHVQADEAKLARWQDRLNDINRVVAHGCNCNRPTLGELARAGFDVTQVEHTILAKVPPFLRPLVVGQARPCARVGAPGSGPGAGSD
jgi:ubiquinone/menaquinone biosynthesis C-methylase UbiE